MEEAEVNLGAELSFSQIQERLTEMLSVFDSFCKENGFRYYMAYGTLLGAVRHGGFIPWDDDIDVVMPRADYERFIEFDSISNDCVIVTYSKEHDYYHPYAYCNLADTKTYMYEHSALKSTGKGLFIDVFPLDGLPSNRKRALKRIDIITQVARLSSYSNQALPEGVSLKKAIKRTLMRITRLLGPYRLAYLVDKMASRYPFDESDWCAQMVLKVYASENELHKTALYKSATNIAFNGFSFMAPSGFEEVLEDCYGDYMKLPPIEQRTPHHNYTVYWRKVQDDNRQ